MSTVEEQKNRGNGAAPPKPARPAPQPAGQTPVRRNRRPRVVIVGAGFGGLNAARALARSPARVLVLDRNNYHGFWPLLYQVATAGLEPESIGYPVRGILRKYHNVGFRMTEVQKVDLERRLVLCERGAPVAYDYLILSAGSTNNYFGNQSLGEHTYPIKDIDEAERLRNRVLSVFEQAVVEPDPACRATLLTFVIIGGEATDKILAVFPPDLQKSALRRLTQMGVEVMLNSPVDTVDPDRVHFKDGSSLRRGHGHLDRRGARRYPGRHARRRDGEGGTGQGHSLLEFTGSPGGLRRRRHGFAGDV
jgi:NADH dehydrogenase